MSLVAYGASSDEDSDYENADEAVPSPQVLLSSEQNGVQTQRKPLNLPQLKNTNNSGDSNSTNTTQHADDFKLDLPAPKKSQTIAEEVDDEFLHKKVQPSLIEKPKPRPTNIRQPVKITIPSLAQLGEDDSEKKKVVSFGPNPSKPNSLLGMLPPPKYNGMFGKPREKPSSDLSPAAAVKLSETKTTSLVPHSVANKLKGNAAKPTPVAPKKSVLCSNYANSDDSDNDEEGGDFFSLNEDNKLPEISASEIKAMVAKKVTRMDEFSRNLDATEQKGIIEDEHVAQQSSAFASNTDDINIEALIGARAAKRARKGDIQFIDISQDQVTFNNDEWKRNQLASETQYQPTGRLNSGDPGAGTKKKHQITYLAHQAKVNEAELQAMWANNRQSRRQTQSKYGF